MKKMFSFLAVAILCLLAACKKQVKEETPAPLPTPDVSTLAAVAACQPPIFQLVVDPSTGFSYLFKVLGSPSAGPVTTSPVNGSLGTNQLITCSGTPIRFATGLAFEPGTGTFYGTTGISPSSPANHILRFNDPNCISAVPAVNACTGVALNLSDVERDPTTGVYYAINRGTANPNNRIVRLGLPGSATVNCLPNFLSTSLYLRGLTVTNGGKLYVMAVNGTSGRLLDVNKFTGAITATYSYPGPITPSPGVNIPEMGLHHDSLCINRFITGNYDPTSLPVLMTDGIPAGLPGGPVYFPQPGVLKPTVDFARP